MPPSGESGNQKAKLSAAPNSFSLNGRLTVCARISTKPRLISSPSARARPGGGWLRDDPVSRPDVRCTRRLTAFRTPSIAGLGFGASAFCAIALANATDAVIFACVVSFIGPSPSWPASPPILRRDMQDCLHHGPYRFRASHWCGLLACEPRNHQRPAFLGSVGLGSGPKLIASSPVA